MAEEQIPVMKPRAVKGDFLKTRIQSIADSGIFSNRGPQVRELESRLATWLGVDESKLVVTSNATVALSSAFALSPARAWDVAGWSFPATLLAPLLLGKRVKLVDIRQHDWLVLDERSGRSVGIVNVIPFGGSMDVAALSYPGELVIDAAASLATRPTGLRRLSSSQAVVFSLHATKVLGGSEGGLAVFGSAERAQQARSWINFGLAGSREAKTLGTNGKMSEYDAAVANARLDGWPEEEPEWQCIRKMKIRASADLGLRMTPASMNAIGPYWIALFKSARQKELVASQLERAGIETRLWWGRGLHRMPAFSNLERGELKNIDDVANRYLGLPFFLGMGDLSFTRVTKAIGGFG